MLAPFSHQTPTQEQGPPTCPQSAVAIPTPLTPADPPHGSQKPKQPLSADQPQCSLAS